MLSARSEDSPHQPHTLSDNQFNAALGKHSEANTGPLEILKNRHGRPATVGGGAYGFKRHGMAGLRTVRKIEPCDVHPGLDQAIQYRRLAAGGTDGTDNFGSAHGARHASLMDITMESDRSGLACRSDSNQFLIHTANNPPTFYPTD